MCNLHFEFCRMPLFYEKNINEVTKLGIWLIAEDESFFKQKVPLHRDVTHPRKRLQHLAGRFILQYLFTDFPYHLIQIADTRKPFIPDDIYHFSISHCGDYAAAIVSKQERVGIDIEIPTEKVQRIGNKFISEREQEILLPKSVEDYTQIWSAKETVFKWYGEGEVDFKKHIQLMPASSDDHFNCYFEKLQMNLFIDKRQFFELCLSYLHTSVKD